MNLDIKVAFLKTSMNDYPGKISAVIFFPFCNLRCPWCHNGALLRGSDPDGLEPLSSVLPFIEKRAPLLGGVTLSGGEPTLYEGLSELIVYIKKLGLSVKLDTNGLKPDVLRALIESGAAKPDFFAMDLKLAPERYISLLTAPRGLEAAQLEESLCESARLIRESGADYEFRSLAFPPEAAALGGADAAAGFFSVADIEALRPLTGERGRWRVRRFTAGHCLDERWNALPPARTDETRRLNTLAAGPPPELL